MGIEPGFQYKMISGMFKLIGVNNMLDKEGAKRVLMTQSAMHQEYFEALK
ncbi:MAG: hypothetical protein II919_02340 [Lachnospiraceae bacterium]|nr:hypothetical protein [Lachnospiraceae bacterium]